MMWMHKIPELSTRQRDHVFRQKLLIMALYLYSLWLSHLVTEALTFSVFFLVSEAPLHTLSPCRCREAKKNFRVPSPAKFTIPNCQKFFLYFVGFQFALYCMTVNSAIFLLQQWQF